MQLGNGKGHTNLKHYFDGLKNSILGAGVNKNSSLNATGVVGARLY
jgi:hypothetical protein